MNILLAILAAILAAVLVSFVIGTFFPVLNPVAWIFVLVALVVVFLVTKRELDRRRDLV